MQPAVDRESHLSIYPQRLFGLMRQAGIWKACGTAELPVGEQLLTQFHRAVTSLVRKMGDLEDACRSPAILRTARIAVDEGRKIYVDKG